MRHKSRLPAILDLGERVVLLTLFSWLFYRMWPGLYGVDWFINGLYLFDQLLVLFFCLCRRQATRISESPRVWAVSFGASFLPLLVIPASGRPIVPLSVAAVLMLSGVALHLAAKLTLRRSFGVVAASRGVKISGPYRFVRHPMYAGYFLTEVAILLAGPNSFNLLIILATWCLQVWRICDEEKFYAEEPAYAALRAQTPYRLIPGLF